MRVMIRSMSMPICNRFHTRRVNSGKIRTFREYSSFTLSFEGNPLPSGTKFCHKITRCCGSPQRRFRDLFSFHCFDKATECNGRTDEQTDGQIDRRLDDS